MTEWLENFAYKVSLSWWMFALAALLSIFIAIITINYQSIKAATRNPIDSLRYE
jgi:putative ABC transport system permease protein